MECLVRLILGSTVLLPFLGFARAIRSKFGNATGDFLCLITASQFHFLFYASRPLPNIFALSLVLLALKNIVDGNISWATKLATTSVILFRFELVLFFGPLYLMLFLSQTANIFVALKNGILTAIVVLGQFLKILYK